MIKLVVCVGELCFINIVRSLSCWSILLVRFFYFWSWCSCFSSISILICFVLFVFFTVSIRLFEGVHEARDRYRNILSRCYICCIIFQSSLYHSFSSIIICCSYNIINRSIVARDKCDICSVSTIIQCFRCLFQSFYTSHTLKIVVSESFFCPYLFPRLVLYLVD